MRKDNDDLYIEFQKLFSIYRYDKEKHEKLYDYNAFEYFTSEDYRNISNIFSEDNSEIQYYIDKCDKTTMATLQANFLVKNEKHFENLFYKNLEYLIPDAVRINKKILHEKNAKIPDGFIKHNNEIICVEMKKGSFNKNALKQLEEYLIAHKCEKGLAIGKRLSCELPANIKFISIDTIEKMNELNKKIFIQSLHVSSGIKIFKNNDRIYINLKDYIKKRGYIDVKEKTCTMINTFKKNYLERNKYYLYYDNAEYWDNFFIDYERFSNILHNVTFNIR